MSKTKLSCAIQNISDELVDRFRLSRFKDDDELDTLLLRLTQDFRDEMSSTHAKLDDSPVLADAMEIEALCDHENGTIVINEYVLNTFFNKEAAKKFLHAHEFFHLAVRRSLVARQLCATESEEELADRFALLTFLD